MIDFMLDCKYNTVVNGNKVSIWIESIFTKDKTDIITVNIYKSCIYWYLFHDMIWNKKDKNFSTSIV